MAKRKKCEKPHAADIPSWPFRSVAFRYSKHTGDTYINAYAVIKMLKEAGLGAQALELAVQIANTVQKD